MFTNSFILPWLQWLTQAKLLSTKYCLILTREKRKKSLCCLVRHQPAQVLELQCTIMLPFFAFTYHLPNPQIYSHAEPLNNHFNIIFIFLISFSCNNTKAHISDHRMCALHNFQLDKTFIRAQSCPAIPSQHCEAYEEIAIIHFKTLYR